VLVLCAEAGLVAQITKPGPFATDTRRSRGNAGRRGLYATASMRLDSRTSCTVVV
jgi:hypothetical protein